MTKRFLEEWADEMAVEVQYLHEMLIRAKLKNRFNLDRISRLLDEYESIIEGASNEEEEI